MDSGESEAQSWPGGPHGAAVPAPALPWSLPPPLAETPGL